MIYLLELRAEPLRIVEEADHVAVPLHGHLHLRVPAEGGRIVRVVALGIMHQRGMIRGFEGEVLLPVFPALAPRLLHPAMHGLQFVRKRIGGRSGGRGFRRNGRFLRLFLWQ
ncbi:MAG: hypothetical protein M2R46_05205 [Verrucomicrobia subdivision 3 bacterium]|nr:hypothetical protein [Limisphaerales bacterium]